MLGGGFAGLAAAAALPESYSVSLVDRTRHFEFLPNIHELVSGVKTPALLRLPRGPVVRRSGHRFVQREILGLELDAQRVHLEGRRPLAYDGLIVAIGGVNATHGVPGVERFALPFKSVEECHRIGRRLDALGAHEGPHDVVLVGGGLEGVEALGEILRRPDAGRFRVHLVEARPRLLPEAPAALDRDVRRLCRGHDVRFLTGEAVGEVREDAVRLASGRELRSDATIWTGGPAPPPLLAESGLAPAPGAWVPVEDTLQALAAPQVFVAGDAAELPRPLSRQGYHALDMGRHAAANLRRQLAGRRLRRFRPSEKPTLVSFGDRSCFLVAGSRVLAGPGLFAAKEAVFEIVMSQLDRRPWWDAAPDALRRLARAGGELAWPALSSPSRLARLARISLRS